MNILKSFCSIVLFSGSMTLIASQTNMNPSDVSYVFVQEEELGNKLIEVYSTRNIIQKPSICNLTHNAKKTHVAHLKSFCDRIYQSTKKPIVLVGVYQGAAAAINLMATHNPAYIVALVLESSIYRPESLAEYKKRCRGRSEGHRHEFLPWSKSEADEVHTLEMLNKIINKNLPILFIGLEYFGVSIRALGNVPLLLHNVHLISTLDSSYKDQYLDENKRIYGDVIHTFYKKYNLPHDQDAALRGDHCLKHAKISANSGKKF